MGGRTATDLDFLAANIHGRRSRLAEGDRLDDLCRIRSLAELARTLYPETTFLTAAGLQRVLVMDRAAELSQIAEKIGGASGRYLDWLRARYQMENLKVLARGFAAGMRPAELEPHLVPLPDDLAVTTDVLAEAGSIDAFAGVVPEGPLREGLQRAMPPYREHPRPFYVEAGLDYGYLSELMARARALPRAHRGDVVEIAQQETDTFHLMLAARGRQHYDLPAGRLRRFHVKGAGIPAKRFGQMLEAASTAEVGRLAEGAAIDGLPPGEDAAIDAARLEALAWDRYWRLANRTFRRAHMGLGAVVAYAAIRRVELANLIRLTEGIRVRLAPAMIRRRLIPRPEGELVRV